MFIWNDKKTNQFADAYLYHFKDSNFDRQIAIANAAVDVAKSNQSWWDQWRKNTINCLGDIYANHGWVSVWAFVQTGYIPFTGLALAIACAMAN